MVDSPKINSVTDKFQTGKVPWAGLGAPGKDTDRSGEEVTSFAEWSDLPNNLLQGGQVARVVSDKGPLAGEYDHIYSLQKKFKMLQSPFKMLSSVFQIMFPEF